jgi:hypothetical protein
MNVIAEENNDQNPSGAADKVCSGCPDADQCRQVWAAPRRGPLTPAGITLASASAFLLPLLCAILIGVAAGAYGAGSEYAAAWQIGGVIAGLMVGVLAARLFMPLIRKHFYEERISEDE